MSGLTESQLKPATGYPLGNNLPFKIFSKILIPLLNTWIKKDWRGAHNLPKQGPVLVVCNHISYLDGLVWAHYLFRNGRAPRFLGKQGIFRAPIVGKVLTSAGQVPVHRESAGASDALTHGVQVLQGGHCLAIYPEGTLTRDENLWPMVAKTGAARIAVTAKVPVIPFAQWGDQNLIPRYSKKFIFYKRHKVTILAGPAIDMSKWYGKSEDLDAMREATAHIMREITKLLEEIRGESAPATIFDPHKSGLPRVGNPKKSKKRD